MPFFNSDKISPPSLKIPKAVQITLKIVDFFSTKLTLIIAAKLFTTPISFPTPKREKAMEESSQKHTLNIPSIKKKIHMNKIHKIM